jgi:hypothetical protein
MTTTPLTASDFHARILEGNPFVDNRINAPSGDEIDVPGLHAAAFERLTELAHEALAGHRGLGAILWGEAGIGKSHLLSRLARWAATDRQACLVYLHNLQAGPAQLPRVLLRCVMSGLTWSERENYLDTWLFRMLRDAVQSELGTQTGFFSWRALRHSLFRILGSGAEGPGDAGLADPTVANVLFGFFRSVLRARQGKEDGSTAGLAVRWLRGEALTHSQAAQLRLPPGRHGDEPAGVEDGQQVKHILSAVTRLAAAGNRPFVLCLDQVDNLDEDQARSLFRFLEALIDSARNLLVVTAGIQSSLKAWHEQRVFQDSAWDRIAQWQNQLLRVSPAQGRQLLEKRLQLFLEPFDEVKAVHQQVFEDPLFPLGSQWFDRQFTGQPEVRPREVINAAREAWHREQRWLEAEGGDAWLAGWNARQGKAETTPPAKLSADELNALIDQKVNERIAEYTKASRAEPVGREALAEAVASLLDEVRRLEPEPTLVGVELPASDSESGAAPYDLLLRYRDPSGGPEVLSGVLLAAGASAYVMGHALGKLAADEEPPRRLLIVSGEEGLKLGEKGGAYLETIRSRPGIDLDVVTISGAEPASLIAMSAVWKEARAEDFEATLPDGRSRPVTASEVMASFRRNGRLTTSTLLQAALKPPAVVAPVAAPPLAMPVQPALAEPVLEIPRAHIPAVEGAGAMPELAMPVYLAEQVADLEVEEAAAEEVLEIAEADEDLVDLTSPDPGEAGAGEGGPGTNRAGSPGVTRIMTPEDAADLLASVEDAEEVEELENVEEIEVVDVVDVVEEDAVLAEEEMSPDDIAAMLMGDTPVAKKPAEPEEGDPFASFHFGDDK